VPLPSTDKADGKCLDKGVQRSTQAITEIIKNHRKCKKDGMKAGTVTDSASLDATCGTFGQIDASGKPSAKLAKLSADVSATCGVATSPLPSLFPGLAAGCTTTAAALGACLQAESRCTACTILNTADGQGMNCDTFDDGNTNGSCAGGFMGLNIGSHVCNLAGSSALNSAPRRCRYLAPTGSIQISVAPLRRTAPPAAPARQQLRPLVIPAIGDVTSTRSPAARRARSIDGGAPLSVDLVADHNIGACSSDSGCATACDSVRGLGASCANIAYGCEGFCRAAPTTTTRALGIPIVRAARAQGLIR
jgi:hypothetical protein